MKMMMKASLRKFLHLMDDAFLCFFILLPSDSPLQTVLRRINLRAPPPITALDVHFEPSGNGAPPDPQGNLLTGVGEEVLVTSSSRGSRGPPSDQRSRHSSSRRSRASSANRQGVGNASSVAASLASPPRPSRTRPSRTRGADSNEGDVQSVQSSPAQVGHRPRRSIRHRRKPLDDEFVSH